MDEFSFLGEVTATKTSTHPPLIHPSPFLLGVNEKFEHHSQTLGLHGPCTAEMHVLNITDH